MEKSPSMLALQPLENFGIHIFISQLMGSTSGRNESDLGFIGVSEIDETEVQTIQPPDDMLYAVEPVGVEIINPYASSLVIHNKAYFITLFHLEIISYSLFYPLHNFVYISVDWKFNILLFLKKQWNSSSFLSYF